MASNEQPRREIDPAPQLERQDEPQDSSNINRRELLIGAAASVAASHALAASGSGYLDVYYEDTTRLGLVVVWVEATTRERYEWRLKASTFAARLNGQNRRFVLRKVATGWIAELKGCSFPGGFKYDLKLTFTWDPEKNANPSLDFAMKRPGTDEDKLMLRRDKNLVPFIKAAFANSATDRSLTADGEISGPVSDTRLRDIAPSLFGDAFEHSKAKDVTFSFHCKNYWILRCGQKIDKGVEPAEKKDSRFAALMKAEGLNLKFKEVAFCIFSDTDGGVGSGHALLLSSQIESQQPAPGKTREDVRALFSGDGAPPPLTGGDAERVLYALVRHNLAEKNVGNFDSWSGDLSFGRKSGGNESAALTVADDGKTAAYLGWRNSGNKKPVLALQVPATLIVKRAASASPSRFQDTMARIWCALDDEDVLRVVASLTPKNAPMLVHSRFGPFTVAPLPPLAARPGQTTRVAAIQIGGSKPRESRSLSHFAAPLALESAAINVASERLAALLKLATDDASQIALRNESYPYSQLTFDEAECLFHIGGLPRRFAWQGKPLPTTEPIQAEALVDLGAAGLETLPVRISLSRATLLVRRPADLLALTYRFQDLVLERDGQGWFVRPDRRLAAFRAGGQPLPPPNVAPVCGDEPPAANSPGRYQDRQDPRPLLVVEFPPQHIAERAFFRRLAAEVKLPVPPKGGEVKPSEAETLRNADLATREAMRTTIKNRQDAAGKPTDEDWKTFVAFRNEFNNEVVLENGSRPINRKIPADQIVYIGPGFLDLETARIARRVQRAREASEFGAGPKDQTIEQILRNVPEVDLPDFVLADLRKKYNITGQLEDHAAVDYVDGAGDGDPKIKSWLDERDELKARRDPAYRAFAGKKPLTLATPLEGFYSGLKKDRIVPGLADVYVDAIDAYVYSGDRLPTPFYGRRNIIARIALLPAADREKAARAIAATVEAFNLKQENDEPFDVPAEARVSGRSRLVFRIPADDFEGGRPDNVDGAVAGGFPFTIEALTNWGAFDLAVVRRAEKVFEPLAGWTRDDEVKEKDDPAAFNDQQTRPRAHGGLRPRWARQETRDEAAKLLHQGITRGDAWAVRDDQQRQGIGQGKCPLPLVRRGTITAAQRMSEVAGAVREPSLFQTSIEIPFRLMLSPAQDAVWRTPLELPADVGLTDNMRKVASLWFAELDETAGASSVRAVWSPDFRPEALLDRDVGAPPHGPWAPWAMSRDVTTRRPYDPTEENPANGTLPKAERFRTGLDVADRHELVALSSLYGLPARGRRAENGTLTDGSQIDPPPGFRLRFAGVEALTNNPNEVKRDHSAIYRPQPIGVSEMTLTALGASLDADTSFVPPASARVVTTKSWKPDQKELGEPLFDAFSIERWRQETRLGRDIRAEVVYKGFLFPFGHRCSLVKLTERRFVAPRRRNAGDPLGAPVAFLVQRMFLRIGAPLKSYPAVGQPNGGRSWPPQKLEILTRVTPDILDPADTSPVAPPNQTYDERPNGRIFLRKTSASPWLPGMVFWPRVRSRKGGEVNFEMQIDGRGARTRMPLIFVDNTAANDETAMEVLTNYYNSLFEGGEADSRRVLEHGGEKRRYAAETEPDGTSFETRSWVVSAEGRESSIPSIATDRVFTFSNKKFDFGSLLQGVDQPPFYPWMERGTIRIAQVDRLTGSTNGHVRVYYDDEHRAFGFPGADALTTPSDDAKDSRRAKTDVYLDFEQAVPLDPGRSGEKSGGAVRPDTRLVALSRSRGPVGNNRSLTKGGIGLVAAPAPPRSTGLDRPDPKSFFAGDASVLGVIDLKEAITFVTNALSDSPQFKEVTEYTSVLLADLTANKAEVAAKVRDQLLVPLRNALLTLAREFYQAAAAVGEVFDEERALERLERFYPDVGRAYRDLTGALDDAIVSANTDRDADALLAHFATIYAAGRRFIQAIDRVANDPLAPVREALREAFNTFIADLIGSIEKFVNSISNDLATRLGKISEDVQTKFGTLLTADVFRPWRHLVLSLPGAHSLTLASPSDVAAVRAAVEQALATIPAGEFVTELLKSPNDAAGLIGPLFDAAFAKIIAGAAGQPHEAALKTAYAAWKTGERNPGECIKGLLFDTASGDVLPLQTLTKIGALLSAANNLIEAKLDLKRGAAALLQFVDAATALLQPLVGSNFAQQFCQGATGPFVAVFTDSLRLPAGTLFPGLDQARSSIQTTYDTAIVEIKLLNKPELVTDAEAIRDAILKQLDQLIAARTTLEAGAREIAKLGASVCQVSPDRMQLDALAIANRTRRALIASLMAFQYSFAVSGSAGVGEALKKLFEKLILLGVPPNGAARTTLGSALQASTTTLETIAGVVRAASALNAPAGSAFAASRAALLVLRNSVPGSKAAQRIDVIIAIIDEANKVGGSAYDRVGSIKKVIEDLNTLGAAAPGLDAELAYLDSAIKLANTAAIVIDDIVKTFVVKLEQRLVSAVAEFLLGGAPYLAQIRSIGVDAIKPAFGILGDVQKKLVDLRRVVFTDKLKCTMPAALDFNKGVLGENVGDDLSAITLQKICGLLVVKHARTGLPDVSGNPQPDNDYLAAESAQLATLAGAGDLDLDAVRLLFEDWKSGRSSAAMLAKQLADAAGVVLSGDLKRIVDLEGARRRIEEKLKEMVPSRIALNYDLKADLSKVAGAISGGSSFEFFLPKPKSQITLSARASYDLIDPKTPPKFTATCQIDPFDINLFNVVTLGFDGALFINESGKGSDFKITYRDFELGPQAEFLKPLQSLMNPDGSGPYVRPSKQFAGIEVGYVLDLGIISFGAIAFINVSISAACELPFGKGAAVFTASIGREDRPVLLSCLPYVGGGFLTLYADARQIIGFAASFEFGGGGAFAFGPLRGQGRISTGIYLRKMSGQGVQIDGFFYVGGEAQIACFAIAASLMVRVSHQPDGTMRGSAVFTFSFSIGFVKLRYSVGVSRTIGKGFSSSGKAASQVYLMSPAAALSRATVAYIKSDEMSLQDNWKGYDNYFSDDFDFDGVLE
ncbi:hypothetical protein [Bradyrhizobium sp. AUGA SZCCT0042]|uniref:hypothetical protein n=1 Tax=Bradyrhizobium sp. AUGA SZCCT0042 TaxID=2807651 RepID=UPI001BA80E2E|nr:hypothetical protein [Bradyrhizobium sp. AUGA SZCCT0042]MBR1300653.1 hypothetical protein [Bradyrhizobium sp. AUGA SZCCT0042]